MRLHAFTLAAVVAVWSTAVAGHAATTEPPPADGTPLKALALSSVAGPPQSQPGDKYAYGNQGMNVAARAPTWGRVWPPFACPP